MTTPAGASALTRGPDLAVVERDDRAVVLSLARLAEQPSPYVLEGPSLEIWRLIDGIATERQIAHALADAYGAPVDQVAADVHAFVAQLLALGLVEHGVENSSCQI